jgi:hypothetical protein
MGYSIFVKLELQAAQSEAIMSIWPILLNLDSMLKPIKGIVILF